MGKGVRVKIRTVAVAAGLVMVASLLAGCLPNGLPAPPGSLFVSPSGLSDKPDVNCDSARFSSIQAAVNAAAPGNTIVVCTGVYYEDVTVSKPLTLRGFDAVINASAKNNGVLITASGTTVTGLTVENAIGEGILAVGVSNVIIDDNVVVNNNRDATNPATTYDECKAFGDVPGDCGEGIHFMGVANSQITNNHVTGNAGGILLTDEVGPTHDNTVSGNVVDHNALDCGITIPSHNPNALSETGVRQPTMGGVFHNTITANTITDNGAQGEGAGVLLAAPGPGMAVYENTISQNWILNNGMSGVTLHSHAPNQDLDGNSITNNVVGTNNLHGDEDAGVLDTTGILIFSDVVGINITIADNLIVSNAIGIWVSGNVVPSADLATGNRFNLVTTPVVGVGP
jgi:parallel beta-helix repeat protein